MMTRVMLTIGLALNLGLFLAVPAPAQPPKLPPPPGPPALPPPKVDPNGARGRQEEELVNKVREAIKKGVGYLKAQQNKTTGNWEGVILNFLADMDGGVTALVALALLNCGEKADDPRNYPELARALEYLDTLPPKKTYVVGLQTMVFAETRQAKYLPKIQRNVQWLLDNAIGFKGGNGELQGWSYPNNAVADNSNTQYALLGLYAAKQAGAKIEDNVWRAIQKFYTDTQTKPTETTGFWRYHNTNYDRSASFTMTVAGVCGLIIAGMGLDQSEQNLDLASGVAARCGSYSENSPVARGMNWIGANFSFEQGKSIFYNIYGIERLGRLSGQRFIGTHDWYREGCNYLVGIQDPGTGAIMKGNGIDGANVLSTAFSLLFLSKGRTPVLVSKFAWGDHRDEERNAPTGALVNWNRKHNDTRHLVEFTSRELFKGTPLAWQVYDVRRQDISTDDRLLNEVGVLLQSPILYLNGHGKLNLTGAQERLLQKYIDEGGFVLAEACCGDKDFADSFRALMKRLFPNSDLRPLPENHAIWSAHFAEPGFKQFAGLEGLEKGCRTVVVFSPFPLAGYWEEHRFMPQKDKPVRPAGDPAARGELAYKLAANVIAYATGLELPKPRLTTTKVFDPNAPDRGATRSSFMAAQLKLGTEAEPAPAAMRNLMVYLRDTARLDVTLKKEDIYPGDPELFKFKFMYLHGRKKLDISDVGIEDIQANCQTGGLLFADAGCNGFEAWKAFDQSFRDFCKKLFPDRQLEVIPASDPIFSAKLNGGSAISSVRCRREKADGTGPEEEMRNYAPYLEGIKINGRWVVIYSKYDIGCALEGHKASDCMGHDRESAHRVAAAVVLYSLKR